MSTTDDTAPAAEIDNAETSAPSIADLIAERHEPQREHEPHREVGEPEPAPAPAAAAPAAPEPAPVAAIPPADPAAKPEAEQPFWYRKEIKREREQRERLERENAELRRQGPQREPPSEEELNRPVTRAEIQAYHEQQRLITKVEASADAFIDKHGEDQYEEVRLWIASKADDAGVNHTEAWALSQRNPWAAAYQTYQREKMVAEIGDDPAAYKAKLEADIRAEYEAKAADQTDRHEPARAPTMQRRDPPPAPASQARSATPRDDGGRFTGATPIGSLTKHKFG